MVERALQSVQETGRKRTAETAGLDDDHAKFKEDARGIEIMKLRKELAISMARCASLLGENARLVGENSRLTTENSSLKAQMSAHKAGNGAGESEQGS